MRFLALFGCFIVVTGKAEIQKAEELLALIRSNYVDAKTINETLLNKALITGLREKIGTGFEVSSQSLKYEPSFFQSFRETKIAFNRHHFLVLQFRDGEKLNRNASDYRNQLFNALKEKSIAGIVMDVRGWKDFFHYEELVKFLSWWLPKETQLFALESNDLLSETNSQIFLTQEEPISVAIPMVVIVNEDTLGVGEALAETLRQTQRAVIVGTQSGGAGLQVSEWSGSSDVYYHIPTRRVVFPKIKVLFPDVVEADVKVSISLTEEQKILKEEMAHENLTQFIFEKESEEKNELALSQKETFTSVELMGNQMSDGEKRSARDIALRTALDILLGNQILKKP